MSPANPDRAPASAEDHESRPSDALDVTADLLHLFSHDIRVPLTTLSAYAELLRSPGLTADQREQFVEAIELQARRLSRMIADLGALALPFGEDADPGEFCAEAITCVGDAVGEVSPMAETRSVKVVFEPAPGRMPVVARPDQLRRGVAWLLEAALRRVASGSTVTAWVGRGPFETRVGVDFHVGQITESDVKALQAFEPGPHPPDLVRGIAGPMWASLHGIERAGARQEISLIKGGLRWTLVLATAT
jgi:nitrogen-specific signal transduction histidine kinase